MDERMRFVIRLEDGETMASLCREFGISRKTGYKIFERYEQCSLEGLTDRTRRPFRYANHCRSRWKRPLWRQRRKTPPGTRKIRERLLRRLPACHQSPGREHDPHRARPPWFCHPCHPIAAPRHRHTALRRPAPQRPLGDGLQRRVPARRQALLLSADRHRPRFALYAAVRGAGIQPRRAGFRAFERPRKGFAAGHPLRQCAPFASPHGLFQLSRLSVWWLRLGIANRAHPARSPAAERAA